MSYLDRLRAKISPDAPKPEPTKPTKPGSVSFVGARPAPSRQISAANDDTEPAQDLPLLAAIAEFDGLIARLCDARGWSDVVRVDLLETRKRMRPDAIRDELPTMRREAAR